MNLLGVVHTKRRRERQIASRFASLTTTPSSSPVTLPVEVELWAVNPTDDPVEDAEVVVTASGDDLRTYSLPALPAKGRHRVAVLAGGLTVAITAGLELHIPVGLGKTSAIHTP